MGSRVSFGQNFGEPICFKQEAFQNNHNLARDGDRPAFTACATASTSRDSGHVGLSFNIGMICSASERDQLVQPLLRPPT
jgi:hypothetical protein